MFADSATLISPYTFQISKSGDFGQLRSFLLWSLLSFSRVNGSFSITYIILSFLLQSYKIAELQPLRILIYSFEVPKTEKTTTKWINKSLKKHHRYIYWVYHCLGKIYVPQPPHPPQSPKGNSRFEIFLEKTHS